MRIVHYHHMNDAIGCFGETQKVKRGFSLVQLRNSCEPFKFITGYVGRELILKDTNPTKNYGAMGKLTLELWTRE